MRRGSASLLDYIISGLAVAIVGVGALGVYDAVLTRAETGTSDSRNPIEEATTRSPGLTLPD